MNEQTKSQYPDTLKAQDIASILRISVSKAYDMMEWKGFPLIRMGRSKRVNRDAFFEWIKNHSNGVA